MTKRDIIDYIEHTPMNMNPAILEEMLDEFSPVPTGKKEITSTEEVSVEGFATAQVVDENLLPENIKKDVEVLGITGTLEEGGNEAWVAYACEDVSTGWLLEVFNLGPYPIGERVTIMPPTVPGFVSIPQLITIDQDFSKNTMKAEYYPSHQ